MKDQLPKETEMSQASEHYTKGYYWSQRQDSDSTYKVDLVESLLRKSKVHLSESVKIAEIGCGQGAFLFPFVRYLYKLKIDYQAFGYDISSQAITLAKSRNSDSKLSFFTGSDESVPTGLDIIFCMDVLEHVENPWEMLRGLSLKSKYVIVHLPLEHSIGHLFFSTPLKSYETFKHIHFFSWTTAKLLIKDSPFTLLDYQFTASTDASLKLGGNFLTRTLRFVRYLLYKSNPDLAVTIGGGSVLLLLEIS